MNEPAYLKIISLLDAKAIRYSTFTHEPCKTSEESQAARAKAGYPGVIGAKALLVKLYLEDEESFATIVIPGDHTLDKDRLISGIPKLKKIRFATEAEMLRLAGVVPGCMPPFAREIFPDIPLLILASNLKNRKTIGFNAAYLDRSIVLESRDYFSLVSPDHILDCSLLKEKTPIESTPPDLFMSQACAYGFSDLFQAAHGRQPEGSELMELRALALEERNQKVREWADKAGWQTKQMLGQDGKEYTAFAPANLR